MSLFRAVVVGVVLLGAGGALAQQNKGPPNALQGFSQNRDQPVHIEAATLEVRDKDKVATFSGDVRVKQGDTGLRSRSLVVFYEQDNDKDTKATGKTTPMTAAKPGPNGEQKIKRLEARGSVVVTQKEQTATGDLGIFDMKTNTVTLTGNVTMTQGPNVLRGDKLVVNLATGVSRVEGRVQGLMQPGSVGPELKPGAAPAPQQPTARPAPGRQSN